MLATEPKLIPYSALLSRSRLGSGWAIAATGAALVALLVLAVYLDGNTQPTGAGGDWWRYLQIPVLIVYILVVTRFLDLHGDRVIAMFRPLVDIDDRAFGRIIAETSGSSRGELTAIGAGAALGIVMSRAWDWQVADFWTQIYLRSVVILFFGLVGSSVYLSLTSSRLFSRLYHEPLKLDIFDMTPLQPVARMSLMISLAFIGAISISLLFNTPPENLLSLDVLAGYGVSILIALLLFFGSMMEAHNVMSRAKEIELKRVRNHLSAAYRLVNERADTGVPESAGELHDSIATWLAYETRIAEAPEWPFTTDTLRTLAISVLLPIIAAVIAEAVVR